jgi:hypothetical protein
VIGGRFLDRAAVSLLDAAFGVDRLVGGPAFSAANGLLLRKLNQATQTKNDKASANVDLRMGFSD